jgi:hypothetical protein
MRIRNTSILLLALLAIGFLWAPPAFAYKTKTHVILANRVLADAQDGKLTIPGLGSAVDPQNQDLIEGLKAYPEAFRAGVLGPDNYPDLAAGQIWVHSNQGDNAEDHAKTFEQRKVEDWRSIDYGMYMLDKARSYAQAGSPQRRRALAFAYGYLGHMIADGFSHSFVNEWAGGAWKLEKGDGYLGPLSEELKHLAVEGLIDTMAGSVNERTLKLSAPIDFLNHVYMNKVGSEREGSFGGLYYVELIKISDKLRAAAETGDFGTSQRSEKFLEVTDKIHDWLSIVNAIDPDDQFIPSPKDQIEHMLEMRADMIDEILRNLPRLSDCIAQNIVLGANRDHTQPLEEDACAKIEWEPENSDAELLFDGALNEIATGFNGDPGSYADSVKRLGEYIENFVLSMLSFDPQRDLEIMHTLEKHLDICEPVLEWGPCEAAQELVTETCAKIAERAACGTCPTSGGKYNCGRRGRWAACAAQPHCFACAGLRPSNESYEKICGLSLNAATGVFEVCGKNSLCYGVDHLQDIQELIQRDVKDLLDDFLEPIKDAAKNAAMFALFGDNVRKVERALALYDQRKNRGHTVWMVNAVFFPEDLRAGGKEYLMRIFHEARGVSMDAMRAAGTAYEFADATRQAMTPTPVGKELLWGNPNTRADDFAVYQNFIKFLFGFINGDSAEVMKQEYEHIRDQIKLQDEVRDDLALDFIDLLDSLGLFNSLGGPTAQRLAMEIAGQSFAVEHLDEIMIDIDAFAPTYNTLQLTKLSLLSGPALATHFGDLWSERSAICRTDPHIMCDGIASLDDPNHHGPKDAPEARQPANNVRYPAGTSYDAERSVTMWSPRTIQWAPGLIEPKGPCMAGKTALSLANTTDAINDHYEDLFAAPTGCLSNRLQTLLAILAQ